MGSKTIHLVSLDATDAAVIAECQRRAWPTPGQISNQNLFFRVSLVVLIMAVLAFFDMENANNSPIVPLLNLLLIAQALTFDLYFRNRRELSLTQQLVCKLINREVAAQGKDAL